MNTVVRSLSTAALMLLVTAGTAAADSTAPPSSAPPAAADTPTEPETPTPAADPLRTEVVFCIDCSGSMSQSITRAQAAIKYLVNEMQEKTPDAPISVGILRYGTGANALEVLRLTNDPKTISSYLSRIKVAGGSEYVGMFIKNAVERMKWSNGGNVNRQIIMVGNETAFQGPIDFRVAAKAANNLGFRVSAIYCPPPWDEKDANVARANAASTTRVFIKGAPTPRFRNNRAILDVENSWILTAYLGGGEAMKLSADPRIPILRYSPMEVATLVEETIPQQEAQMAQTEAAFAAYDMTRGAVMAGRGTPMRGRGIRGRR